MPSKTHLSEVNEKFLNQEFAGAKAALAKALEQNPAFFLYHERLGDVHAVEGRKAEARACYKRALELNPRAKWITRKLDATEAPSPRPFCGLYEFYPDTTGKRKAEGGRRMQGTFKASQPDQPLVTIVTAVYDNPSTFQRCIDSVRAQTYSNVEYIVVDGGSPDSTLDILRRNEAFIDYFVSEPDGGIYAAMNKGIELAQGEYICVLNSDDYYHPEFIAETVGKALHTESDVAYTLYSHGGSALESPGIGPGILLGHLNLNHAGFLVHRDCYNKVGGYSEEYRIMSDMLWMRRAFRMGMRFRRVDRHLLNFSVGGLSSGGSEKQKRLVIAEAVRSTQHEFHFLTPEEARDIYLLRFDKKRLSSVFATFQQYADDSLFAEALKGYVEYCFKYRDEFRLSHEESGGCFLQFIKVAKKIGIGIGSIRMRTSVGCFSELVGRIDEVAKYRKKRGKKKFLHYAENFSTPSETFIYDLLVRLESSTDFDNYFLCDNRILQLERPYDKCVVVSWTQLRPEVRNELYRYLFDHIRPDIIIAHFAINEWKLSRRTAPLGISVPAISMTHGIDVFALRTNQEYRRYLVEEFSTRRDTAVTTVSHYLKRELEAMGVPPGKITLVHNTADDRFWENRKQDNFYDGSRTLHLLAIGRLVDWKGHVHLLEGLRHLKDSGHPDVDLTIIYGKAGDRLEKTKQEIASLDLSDSVKLVEFVNFAETPAYLAAFDIFVLPSTYSQDALRRSETFGVATLEAIAAGLPVVVTDAGGSPEVVGVAGPFAKIVPHGDGQAIGEALRQLVEAPETFEDNRAYAQERLERFSASAQIQALVAEVLRVTGSKIKVALFSSSTVAGAGYAALRVHRSLEGTLVESTLFTKTRQHSSEKNVQVVSHPSGNGDAWNVLQNPARSEAGLTIFSLNHPVLGPGALDEMVSGVDVVNLHWTARFLSVENIAHISRSRKPLVITVRDMHPLTGGCHYFHGCREWQYDCKDCPQLVGDLSDFPRKVLAAKRAAYDFSNIVIVTLSQHTASIVRQAPFFKACDIRVIPNSIEIEVFRPYDRIAAREELGLPLDRPIIGYVPSFSSKVKGYEEVLKALTKLADDYPELDPFVMLIGNPTPANERITLDKTSIGYIEDNCKLAKAYSAADVVVVPSLEETFSNTTAEAIACGTPVVGFRTGAIPDMVKDGVTGYTFPVGDSGGLAHGLYRVLTGKDMSTDCRAYAKRELGMARQAARYEALITELYARAGRKRCGAPANGYESVFAETTQTVMDLLVQKAMGLPCGM